MKNVISNTRFLFTVAALLGTMSFSAPAMAADVNKENPVEISVIHVEDDAPVFQLHINNENLENFTVVIKDKQGIIYTESLKGTSKDLVRMYQFVKEDANAEDEITIEVKNASTNKVITYTIYPSNANQITALGSIAKK
ncbi:MAG: hypothetical protein ACOYKE_06900 [Ferruginibacter sp.]